MAGQQTSVLNKTRRKADTWDRLKFLILLTVITTGVVGSQVQPPFITVGQALRDFFGSSAGRIIGIVFILEVIRQIHYRISETSEGYHSFWQRGVFGSVERGLDHFKPWTRFRLGRFIRWMVIVGIYAVIVTYLVPDIDGPIQAISQAPRLFVALITSQEFIRIVLTMSMLIGQFVLLFWFLSRGGMNIIMPEEIKTRFSDVWGQDHVLDLIKENIAFLEKPDEIEAKGGYIPGGILLWGPPGTGKTLMAEAIAGETGRPYVFVDPGAFTNMFMGVGILKVKSLYRKLRKLSLRHGGVIVFLDEADSLGSRGQMGAPTGGGGLGSSSPVAAHLSCNGFSYLSSFTQNALASTWAEPVGPAEGPRRSWINRIIMGGMGGGGGMGTLQALLSEMNGLTKPRGLSNRLRKMFGFRPKPPPKYRILHILATNMPNALDEAMLRPGRIDRIYKVGYPSKEGRKQTLIGYLNKVAHSLNEEEVEKLSVVTPFYSGAKIKDLVNEALIIAIRDGRESIVWPDVWKAKALKELGPPEDVDYIERERHAVAIHEASHAVAAHLLGAHRRIDMVTIEKRATTLGMVRSLGQEERYTQWKSEFETDIMVSLASRAGERMFFGNDNSSGVSGDLTSATTIGALMEGAWGMGTGLVSYANTVTSQAGFDYPVSVALRTRRDEIQEQLVELYDRVDLLLAENRDKVLELASALEEKKTISGDEVAEIMGTTPGEKVMREPVGWQSVTEEVGSKRREDAKARRLADVNGHPDDDGVSTPDGGQPEEEPVEATSE